MRRVFDAVLKFVKTEPILIAATLAAVVTAFFVPPDQEYLGYVNWRTIAGLTSIFISIKGLERTRFFKLMSVKILALVTSSRTLVTALVFIPTILSFFITNDVSVVIFVPFSIIILTMCGMQRYVMKTVILICIGTGMSGLLSPIANAQNIFLFAYYELPITYMFQYGWPLALAGFGLLAVFCLATKNENIETFEQTDIKLREVRFSKFVILFVLSVLAIVVQSSWFYWAVLILVFFVAVIVDYKSVKRTRYLVLITYIMFFIFAGNLKRIPAVNELLASFISGKEFFLAIGLSELISNTPATVILSQFSTAVLPLMLGLNIGKLGTIQASMMNITAMSQYMNFDNRAGRYICWFTLYNLAFLALLVAVGCLTLFLYGLF